MHLPYIPLNPKFKKGCIVFFCVLLAAALAAAFLIPVLSGLIIVKPLADAGISDNSAVTLISHRGMVTEAPENTVEAIKKSAENGYAYVEFDVRRTKDGVWVLMHDSDISRTTTGKGEVSELTYKQLISYRIDDGKNLNDYGIITVPTLSDALTVCNENNLIPVIEIKQSGTEHIPELINRICERRNTNLMIISFDREQLEIIHTLVSTGKTTAHKENISLWWLTKDLSSQTLEAALKSPGIGVSFNGNKAGSPEEIKAFSDKDIPLAVWTINSASRFEELYNSGITRFTTDAIIPNTEQE